jgi:selenocysteine-specific elongation factor
VTSCPVIVIGHVDHGKTSLVRALTGIDTDRLPEEKARGLSITAGYAYRQYGDAVIDLIDAPGHENFIRAMVSGASGARAALLVLSASEGVRAQTLEHIQIVDALGIQAGVIALTKADLVACTERESRMADLRAAVAGTCFRDAPMIFCSSMTGEGLESLHAMLKDLSKLPNAPGPPGAFLAIDRVFVSEGHGTVVTGTLQGGALKPEDELVLAPNGRTVAVRRVQVRGRDVPLARDGERTALNLRGISSGEVKPGDIMCATGVCSVSLNFDVEIQISARASRGVRHMEHVRVLYATSHTLATVRLLDAQQIGPGEKGFAQLRFSETVAGFAGQRAIIRSLSPQHTLGAAIILDPAASFVKSGKTSRLATLKAAERRDLRALAAALADEHAGIVRMQDFARLARAPISLARTCLGDGFVEIAEGIVATAAATGRAREGYLGRLAAYHKANPLKLRALRSDIRDIRLVRELADYVETTLAAASAIHVTGAYVALEAHKPSDHLTPAQAARMGALASQLKSGGLAPSGNEVLVLAPGDEDLIELLIDAGSVVRLFNVSLKQTILISAEVVGDAARILRESFPGEAAFTTSEARAALKTSRKYIVPLLEQFDAAGITRRTGDTRFMVAV